MGARPLKFGEQLSKEEQQALYQLLLQFPTIIAKHPGRTNQAQHRIITGDNRPVHQ